MGMIHKSFFLAVICFVIYFTYCSKLPASIPKCAVGNDVCIAKSITYIIQNSNVYPEVKIPNLEPYTPAESWILRTVGTNLPIRFVINTSDMQIYGFRQIIVNQFAGFRPNLRNTKIPSKVSLSQIKVSANFKATAQLLMLNIKPEGILTMDLMDATIPISYDGEFIRRNGKDYYNIKSVKAHANVSRMQINAKCKNINGFIENQLNNLLNEHWKVLKAEMDDSLNEYIGEIIRTIVQPILNQVAVQDFYKI